MAALTLIMDTAPSVNLWADYAKTMSVLAGICLLAMAAVKIVLPRWKGRIGSSPDLIRVLATRQLQPKKALHVVKAGETFVLVATSGDAVHFMTELDGSSFPKEFTESSAKSA